MEVEAGNKIRPLRLVTEKATYQGAAPRKIARGASARSVPRRLESRHRLAIQLPKAPRLRKFDQNPELAFGLNN
jgi:hypothetical protein